jgi:glycosyltransferase involved in cell wall biosynthesis
MSNINYFSFLNNTGYGQSAIDYILAIKKYSKHNIEISSIGGSINSDIIGKDKSDILKGIINKGRLSDEIAILHSIPTIYSKYQNKHKKKIGFAIYETYDAPESWIPILNRNDAIIVPSKFNKDVFLMKDIKKEIYHIPHCFDDTLFNSNYVKKEKINFLFIASWRQRKGYEILCDVWAKYFYNNTDITLTIKTDKIDIAKEYIKQCYKRYHKKIDISNIEFLNNKYSIEGISKIIGESHFVINPSMGEGFCLPGLFAMACNVPFITTNYSGVLDYATSENSYLLDVDKYLPKPCLDNIPQFKNRKWAIISSETMKKAIFYCIDNYEEMQDRSALAYKYVHENYRYEHIARKFDKMLEEIYE